MMKMIGDQAAIDWVICVKKAMYNENLAFQILRAIVCSLPSELSYCESAYNRSNYRTLLMRVQSLHDNCLASGLPRIDKSLKTLERVLKDNSSQQITVAFEQFKMAINETIETYKRLYLV